MTGVRHIKANRRGGKLFAALIAACCVAGTGQAAERPAPDYYLDALIDTTTAQQLALSCPTLSVNLPRVAQATGDVIARLEEDGFTMTAEQTGMEDATDALASRQDAFVTKYGLQNPSADAVCAAGRAEIQEGTVMGSYLIEVSG
ncbi:DUF5333 family protein [Ascidiaceihabitans sp.]|uniref:DUF5333 family protein n=1 Tax=Ascidiaceihabitans sp. TaxID=1872644 RepID=UPI003296BCA8